MASPWPISSTVTCSRPSGSEPRVIARSTAPRQPTIGSGRRARRKVVDRALGWSSVFVLSSTLSGPPTAQLARARIGSHATASDGGTVTSIAANGTDAAAVPRMTMTRSTSQAAPPANQVTAVPISGAWTAPSSIPATEAMAPNSIVTGTNGTTSTFAMGATSERRSKFTRMTGRVVSWAANVSDTGSRIHGGQPASRRPMGAPNQMRPAVARSESWKPTSTAPMGPPAA